MLLESSTDELQNLILIFNGSLVTLSVAYVNGVNKMPGDRSVCISWNHPFSLDEQPHFPTKVCSPRFKVSDNDGIMN